MADLCCLGIMLRDLLLQCMLLLGQSSDLGLRSMQAGHQCGCAVALILQLLLPVRWCGLRRAAGHYTLSTCVQSACLKGLQLSAHGCCLFFSSQLFLFGLRCFSLCDT